MSTALSEERATQPLFPFGNVIKWLAAVLPGVAITSSVAAASYGLRSIPGLTILSPMILSIFLGITIRNTVGTPAIAKAGIAFSLRRVLRFAIILLGLQLTAAQAAEVGAMGLAVIVTGLIATFLFTKWLGRVIGVERKLAELIAAGTSICGASAVIATNTVTDAPDEDVAYAVACVTVFGSVAMFVYPLLPGLLHLSEHAFGLWTGASIHEIAQVVAAAYQDGSRAGEFATVAKLSRVMMLAPVVIALGLIARRKTSTGEGSTARVPLPLFVLGFIALAGLNSIIT
ncbi:MAG: YeiH family protein, partial [Bradyrhizobium sp.]